MNHARLSVVALGASLAAPPRRSAQPAPHPVSHEDLLSITQISAPQIAPDGQ